MRILIIAWYLPPVNHTSVGRAYSWAKSWSDAGHEVTVLGRMEDPARMPVLPAAEVPDTSGFRVEKVRYLNSPPAGARADRAAGSGRPRAQGKSGLAKALWRRSRDWLGFDCLLNVSHAWAWPAYQRALQLADERPFEVVVSTFGPPACHFVAAMLRSRYRFFWVADYRDLWLGMDLYPERWPFNTLAGWLERRTVRAADLITTVSEPFAEMLGAKLNKPAITIYNGFDGSEPVPVGAIDHSEKPARLIYTGTVRLNHRKPDILFDALAALQRERPDLGSRLQVEFFTADTEYVEGFIRSRGLAGVVRTMGMVSRGQAIAAQQSADGLLFLDWNSTKVRGVLSAKIFEYLISGKPILCIGGDGDSGAAPLVRETGTGISTGNDQTRLEGVLRELRDGGVLPFAPDRQRIREFHRDVQAARLLAEIERRRDELRDALPPVTPGLTDPPVRSTGFSGGDPNAGDGGAGSAGEPPPSMALKSALRRINQ